MTTADSNVVRTPLMDRAGSVARRGCPVCTSVEREPLHIQHLTLPAEFGLPEVFAVVTCAGCGMAYSDTVAESERLTAHYRAESYSMHNWEDQRPVNAAGLPGSPLDIARLRVVVEHLARTLPDRASRILDVGCASGALLTLLGEAGFSDVTGIDPSPGAVAAARRLGRRAHVADLDGPLPDDLGTFDVAIVSHVLEHVGRPRQALDHLRGVLRPGALVYAEVPDAARYAEFLAEPFVDFNHEHINHFSSSHLDGLFGAGGFTAMHTAQKLITVVNWPYPVIYGMWRMLDTTVRTVAPAVCDRTLHDRLVPYVTGSHDLLRRYSNELAARLAGRRRIALRCLGYRAWTLLAGTILRDLDIVAYIDTDPAKQNLHVRGIRVTGPAEPLAAGIPVVVVAFHAAEAVVAEYAAADPQREVIAIGRSIPVGC